MIEGQEGVSWEDWVQLARVCERSGLEGLFRSDHYTSAVRPGDPGGSLDAWATLAALAPITERIRLGTLVSPVGFRHPSVLAKSVLTVDHASRGRVEVGLGAGWMELEHRAYGFDFPETSTRTELLAEQVEIVHRHLSGERFSFAGRHYRLADCEPAPPALQRPRPPIIIGGGGRSGTTRPAARFADEYNTTFPTLADVAQIRRRLDEACERARRKARSLPLSIMTGCVVGRDGGELEERLRRRAALSGADETPEEYAAKRRDRFVIGTVEEAADRLRAYEAAGVERAMLQHLDHADLDMVELIGRELVPAVGAGK